MRTMKTFHFSAVGQEGCVFGSISVHIIHSVNMIALKVFNLYKGVEWSYVSNPLKFNLLSPKPCNLQMMVFVSVVRIVNIESTI